uniref:RanBP2-type domain-containing protein n=1 Tax=Phytophthora ramorum TaxID=164328 RepID=H3HC06_PHYRM
METSAPSRGGRKRRGGGKRKRSASRNSEDEERKTQDPPKAQEEEEKGEEEKEENTPKNWNCPACTFLNEAPRCFCEMCETPNPSPPVVSTRALSGAVVAADWNCAACTMVNPAAMRVCGMCGTLNPRPPPGLSIGRLSGRDGDDSLSSSSDDSLDDSDEGDSDDEEEEGDAWRPKVARKDGKAAANEKKSKEEKKQALLKKRKRRKHEKKLQERAKMAYGVSIYELKKLVLEPTSSRLVDTLQTLTHTLAMMDASAENEWADDMFRGHERTTEAFALRELLEHGRFVGYLDFLLRLVDGDEEKDGGFHPSIVMTALEMIGKLVTPEVLHKFVAVVVNASGEESEDSRLSMVSLLLHLFDNRPQLVSMFVQEKIYTELFSVFVNSSSKQRPEIDGNANSGCLQEAFVEFAKLFGPQLNGCVCLKRASSFCFE